MRYTRLTDAHMRRIAKMHNLTSLDLGDCTGIAQVGLHRLLALTRLMTLGLAHTDVTDDCLTHVGQIRGLNVLRLSGCKDLTAEGIAAEGIKRLTTTASRPVAFTV
jgi:hypothetical protein